MLHSVCTAGLGGELPSCTTTRLVIVLATVAVTVIVTVMWCVAATSWYVIVTGVLRVVVMVFLADSLKPMRIIVGTAWG